MASKKSYWVKCSYCKSSLIRKTWQLRVYPKHYCSKSCHGKYHNIHNKKWCNNRSKLEKYIESQLSILYPKLRIIYNDKKILNGLELDILVPKLSLAIELNGIFHFKDVHGKLAETQRKDREKRKICRRLQVSLRQINTTSMKYFKPEKAQKFLDIVMRIIDKKLAEVV